MRLGILVNRIDTEAPNYTSTGLGRIAHARGHEVCYLSVEDFTYRPRDVPHLRVRMPPSGDYETGEEFLDALQSDDAATACIDLSSLDVLLLRNDPSSDALERPWASNVGIYFGQEAARRGVITLNDPDGLAGAMNKLYFQSFPESVRPPTLITRHVDEIRDFAERVGKLVVKPLQGSGGQSVFLVRENENANLNQMIDAVKRDGYVIAQEYMPEAEKGDVRIFVLDGQLLEVDGKAAILRRVGADGDMRSNMHAGGHAEREAVSDTIRQVVDTVRPKLIADGMFLVGLDLVGDQLLEINVFSPGGLNSAGALQGVDFVTPVVESLERKVRYARSYPGALSNRRLATL